jgi:hypothetical protein
VTAPGLQVAYEILRDTVLHPSSRIGDGPIGRAVLVREGLAAWIRMVSRPPPTTVDPPPAAAPAELTGVPAGRLAGAIATLILSLPLEEVPCLRTR